MNRVSKSILTVAIILMGLLLISNNVSAVSYSDADGDGINEPGEEITFEGDITYINDYGSECRIRAWFWDFDSDGEIDAEQMVANHTFDEAGHYNITLYQINGKLLIVTIYIEVKDNEPIPEPDDDIKCKKLKKILKLLEKDNMQNKKKVKKILKLLKKSFKIDLDTDDLDEIEEFLEEFIEEFDDDCKKHCHHCHGKKHHRHGRHGKKHRHRHCCK